VKRILRYLKGTMTQGIQYTAVPGERSSLSIHCEAVWIRGLLCEVGQRPGKEPTLIYHDNQGSISWAEGGLHKAKHVELKYHFTQHLIQSGQAS
jgi:hypothetical protein